MFGDAAHGGEAALEVVERAAAPPEGEELTVAFGDVGDDLGGLQGGQGRLGRRLFAVVGEGGGGEQDCCERCGQDGCPAEGCCAAHVA